LQKVGNKADTKRATLSRNEIVLERDHNLTRRIATPRAIDLFVGDRLRELRETRQIAVSEVSSAAAISEGRLARYERGELRVSPSDLIALAELFGVELAALFPCDGGHYAAPLH
jgi:hypothetical protein